MPDQDLSNRTDSIVYQLLAVVAESAVSKIAGSLVSFRDRGALDERRQRAVRDLVAVDRIRPHPGARPRASSSALRCHRGLLSVAIALVRVLTAGLCQAIGPSYVSAAVEFVGQNSPVR